MITLREVDPPNEPEAGRRPNWFRRHRAGAGSGVSGSSAILSAILQEAGVLKWPQVLPLCLLVWLFFQSWAILTSDPVVEAWEAYRDPLTKEWKRQAMTVGGLFLLCLAVAALALGIVYFPKFWRWQIAHVEEIQRKANPPADRVVRVQSTGLPTLANPFNTIDDQRKTISQLREELAAAEKRAGGRALSTNVGSGRQNSANPTVPRGSQPPELTRISFQVTPAAGQCSDYGRGSGPLNNEEQALLRNSVQFEAAIEPLLARLASRQNTNNVTANALDQVRGSILNNVETTYGNLAKIDFENAERSDGLWQSLPSDVREALGDGGAKVSTDRLSTALACLRAVTQNIRSRQK